MGLIVVNPGVHTTVQDLGRVGFREFGVPVAGAFDTISHRLANALVGNPAEHATLEMTLVGGIYEADTTLALALAGADSEARLERAAAEPCALQIPQSFTLQAGERLSIGGMAQGARCYLAVSGGWQTALVLGSRSSEIPIRAGATLPCVTGVTAARRPADPCRIGLTAPVIRVLDGPDAPALYAPDWWTAAVYRVGKEASRMGVRLEGPRIEVKVDPERLSAPVLPGAVQVAGGQPILLGVACGTLGGYPHVAQVISADMPRVGQLRPGMELRFQRISLDEAREYDETERRTWDERFRMISLVASDHTP